MYTNITINGVVAKVLLDTGASDDFVATHFVTTNHLPVKRHDMPLAIQQAVRGSKPKSNGTSKLTVKFGTWTKSKIAHITGLAGYDAILGMPTLMDGGAIIDVKNRKVNFRQWGVTFNCTEPDEPLKPPRVVPKWNPKNKSNSNSKPKVGSGNHGYYPSAVTKKGRALEPQAAAAMATRPTSTVVDKEGSPAYYRGLLEKEFKDVLVDELPNELPPLREINYHIPYHPKTP
jgi:hypothetical protein